MLRMIVFGAFMLLSFLFTTSIIYAQEKTVAKADSISILDTKKLTDYLNLRKSQKEDVLSLVAQIQNVVDEDKKIREEMRAKFVPGQGMFNREALQTFRAEQMERQKKIDSLAARIQAKLDANQKEKFTSVIVPNLQEMARAERGRWRQMRQQ